MGDISSMQSTLLNHIRSIIKLSDEGAPGILSHFTSLEVPKKEILLEEGEFCRHYYFVEKGCLRLYFVDHKGMEQTIQFAIENWWLTDLHAFRSSARSSFSIQSVEKTKVQYITKKQMDELLTKYPGLHQYFSYVYERAYAATLFRVRLLRLTREETYQLFIKNYPGFVQRVPQKLVASFLGFTPEYLSELRRKQMGGAEK